MIKFVLGIIFIVGLCVGGWFFYPKQESIQLPMAQKDLFLELVLSATPKLKQQWEDPDLKERKSCPEEGPVKLEVGEAYYSCNMNYWNCWHKKHPTYEIKLDQKTYHLRVQGKPKFGKISTKAIVPGSVISSGMKVALSVDEIPGAQIDLLFEDTCRSTYLMQRTFPSGPDDQRGMVFDTFGKDYFIDKFVVTNRDVHEWIETGVSTLGTTDVPDPELWAYPAGHLNLEQQKLFCLFHGKKLLEAHLLDAASFYPGEVDNPMKGHEARSIFFWAPEEKAKLKSVTKESCELMYTSDCLDDYQVMPFAGESYSDTGLFRPLGGVIESIINRKSPHFNLKVSSTLFSYRDIVHNIGLRAHWEGESVEHGQFDWKLNTGTIVHPKNEPQDHVVGFRCYFEREGEQ